MQFTFQLVDRIQTFVKQANVPVNLRAISENKETLENSYPCTLVLFAYICIYAHPITILDPFAPQSHPHHPFASSALQINQSQQTWRLTPESTSILPLATILQVVSRLSSGLMSLQTPPRTSVAFALVRKVSDTRVPTVCCFFFFEYREIAFTFIGANSSLFSPLDAIFSPSCDSGIHASGKSLLFTTYKYPIHSITSFDLTHCDCRSSIDYL